MALVHAKLELHDLRDAYAFAATVVQRKLRSLNDEVSEEDAVQLLVVKLWQRAERFNSSIGTFSGYASRYAGALRVDVVRELDGRTRWKFADHAHERRRPDVVSLEAETESGRGGLDETLGVSDMDAAERRSPTLARVLGG